MTICSEFIVVRMAFFAFSRYLIRNCASHFV
nr:MAG TPA: hypothetical protein [Caudoviricetes sp.]